MDASQARGKPGETHDHLDRNLFLSIVLNVFIVAAEIAGGILSGSLALLSDAIHNLSDVVGLLLAWGGHALGSVAPSPRRIMAVKASAPRIAGRGRRIHPFRRNDLASLNALDTAARISLSDIGREP